MKNVRHKTLNEIYEFIIAQTRNMGKAIGTWNKKESIKKRWIVRNEEYTWSIALKTNKNRFEETIQQEKVSWKSRKWYKALRENICSAYTVTKHDCTVERKEGMLASYSNIHERSAWNLLNTALKSCGRHKRIQNNN